MCVYVAHRQTIEKFEIGGINTQMVMKFGEKTLEEVGAFIDG